MTHQVIRQSWTESERGWGQRPDGYSLHLNEADMRAYNREYWAAEHRRNPSGIAPDEYSRPDENPHTVTVTDKLYQELLESKPGLRYYSRRIEGVLTP